MVPMHGETSNDDTLEEGAGAVNLPHIAEDLPHIAAHRELSPNDDSHGDNTAGERSSGEPLDAHRGGLCWHRQR